MKFLLVLFCSCILFPLSGVSLQDPGDPDSVVNEVDTICFRQDSLIYINDPRHTFSTNFNWLDSYIDDFTQQLANNPDPDYNEQIDEPCDIDYQLEFGIGDDMANNNNNGSGNDGGSTY